ncbi:hypothetical protein GCM10009535_49460 [Streptomyces thermocarboxydovorans]|uniref:Uncharacterized protein n=1 Tax=Streptomyces thermocarboxydovorans TaxID=59298 RepID=A0ABP3SX99_9ACTN
MTQRNQIRGALGTHDSRDPGRGEGIALGNALSAQQFDDVQGDQDPPARARCAR